KLRPVRFFLESGAGDDRVAVVDLGGDGKVVDAEIGVFAEVLGQDGIFAVVRPAGQQIAALHLRRYDVQAAPARTRGRRATASTTSSTAARFPCTDGIALQGL